MSRLARIALPALLCLAAPAQAEESPNPPRTPVITMQGEGVVRAVPDIASITLGVSTEAPDAAGALSANNGRMRELIAAVRSFGIAEGDIATSSLSISPQLEFPQDGRGSPRLTGYVARNAVTVTVRALDRLGPLLDRAVAQGGNEIDNLSFDVADRSALLDRARADAVADARRKAERVAAAAGVRLGPIRSIAEPGAATPLGQPRLAMTADAKGGVPIEAGSRELRAAISITWEIAEP